MCIWIKVSELNLDVYFGFFIVADVEDGCIVWVVLVRGDFECMVIKGGLFVV